MKTKAVSIIMHNIYVLNIVNTNGFFMFICLDGVHNVKEKNWRTWYLKISISSI